MYSFGLDELRADLQRVVNKLVNGRARGGYIKRAIYADVIAQIDKILSEDKKQEIWLGQVMDQVNRTMAQLRKDREDKQ
jgi:hypothetical protein